jgi:hypothetical protein
MPRSSITVAKIARAYAASTGAQAKTAETLFKNEYLDIKAIFDAASDDDDSLCRIGSGRVSYNSIAAYLEAHRNEQGMFIKWWPSFARAEMQSAP